ncbi:flagellar cap protein [Nautilia sp. PV-1]|uniref:flagellar filament capping protein FliD n=1 Tax=Nautilia sp. PV-1 TaxID=2579250 RepID=UPI000FD79622|nr:flagellar filament capping protein FliD [Nautilia sp. PV-1]AZV46192.1 flagellar cap protein [Nautilia sp. PV-1]
MADLGILSSLGAGSNGVLSYDVIDKLKKADEDMMVKPLEDKLDLLKKKESALSQFITIGSTVKTDILDLADGTLFAKVNTTVNGSSVSVTANDGVEPQSFDINVSQLAQNDVYQSKGYASTDSLINGSGTSQDITIGTGGTQTTISIPAGATLQDLKDAINNANAGVTASIIDTGIGDDPYKLVLKANETGKDNYIEFNYSGIDDLGLNATNYTSATYSSDTDLVNNSGSDQTFNIDVNGTTYSMNVADGTTVSDFINALNSGDLKDSEGNSLKVNASYNSDTGAINFGLQAIGDISITDTGLTTNFNDNTDFTNSNRLQTAQDSVFTYNGVQVERSSNTVDDLITGVTINLESEGDSTVDITSNVDDMTKAIQKFVADYNQMISNLQSLTAYDKDTGNVGLFQGDSDFTMLENRFSNDIFGVVMSNQTTATDLNGNQYTTTSVFTAADVGFSMDKTGMISFDADKFKEAYNKDPDLTNRLFGDMFTRLKTDFDTNITGDKSNLNLLDQEIKGEEDRYHDRIDAMNKYLETKYNIMAKQFAAYDEMINKLNVQSQTLQQTIEQAIAAKK